MTSSSGCVADRAEEQPQARDVLIGRQQGDEIVQRHQHQAETDQDTAEIPRPGGGAAEHQQADQDQGRRDLGDIEGQDLDDEGRADIGAQHDGERRHELDQTAGGEAGDHEARGRAALENGRHAHAGQEGLEAIAQRIAEEAAQPGAEGALDAGLHHVDAPQQERDRTGEIEERY